MRQGKPIWEIRLVPSGPFSECENLEYNQNVDPDFTICAVADLNFMVDDSLDGRQLEEFVKVGETVELKFTITRKQ